MLALLLQSSIQTNDYRSSKTSQGGQASIGLLMAPLLPEMEEEAGANKRQSWQHPQQGIGGWVCCLRNRARLLNSSCSQYIFFRSCLMMFITYFVLNILLLKKCIIIIPQQLVDEHSGEQRDENPDDREAEQGPKTGVESSVDHLAVWRVGKDVFGTSYMKEID